MTLHAGPVKKRNRGEGSMKYIVAGEASALALGTFGAIRPGSAG